MNPSQLATKRITDALVAEGFRARKAGILTATIDGDVCGWLGLNLTSKFRIVEANIVVGVRSESLERFIAELVRPPIFATFAPSIAIHIGYLMPERTYHPWFFDDDFDRETVGAITAAVREFAFPFFKRNASMARLAECLRDPTLAHRDQVIYRLPACYALLEDHDTATTLCDEYLQEVKGRHNGAAEQYRAFARALKDRLKHP